MLRVIESPGRRISRVVIPPSPGGASKSSRGRGCRRTLGGPMPAADADLTLMIREGQKLGPAKDHRIVPGWHVTRTPSSGPSKSSSPKSGGAPPPCRRGARRHHPKSRRSLPPSMPATVSGPTSPGKITTASDHVAPVQRSLPPFEGGRTGRPRFSPPTFGLRVAVLSRRHPSQDHFAGLNSEALAGEVLLIKDPASTPVVFT